MSPAVSLDTYPVRNCSCCGTEYPTGGYAHPSKCWHCAPPAVSVKKVRRNLRKRGTKYLRAMPQDESGEKLPHNDH